MLNEQNVDQAQRLRDIAKQKQAAASAAGAAGDPLHGGGGSARMRMLSFPELKSAKGIPFSVQWICKLVRDGLFPVPVKLGAGPSGTNLWIEAEIDAWIETKASQRRTNVAPRRGAK